MPKKVRLTPIQRDILWLLEEAGEETVATTIASVKPLNREAFDHAVKGLVWLGLVVQSEWPKDSGGSLLLTRKGEQGLRI